MKTNNKKAFLNMDERNKKIMYEVVSIMYLLSILAITGIVLYKQLALGQDIYDFQEIGIVLTVNVIFLVSALLFYGAIPIRKLKVKTILLIYLAFVVLGNIFTWAKYNLFQSSALSIAQLFDKLIAIFSIVGLLMLFWIFLSILGKRRIEKELE